MTSISSNGQLNRADSRLWAAMDTPPAAHGTQTRRVRQALAGGANPNLCLREFQNFRSVLGMAVLQRNPELAQLLIASGALAHWPENETDIEVSELTGEGEDVSYGGYPVDPLGIALEQLAWVLAEAGADETNAKQQTRALREIVELLMEHGATLRSDPATCKAPLDSFMMILVENPYNFASWTLSEAAEIVFDTLQRVDPGSYKLMLEGQWEKLAACPWEWHQDFPELPEHLTLLAQELDLQQSTPAARSVRATRL